MILGTKARYAVMAMVELASREQGKPITLAELATSQEITIPYLEQIFSKLKQGGLVKSVRGPGGGYVLSRPAAEISISEIVNASEEAIKMTRCDNHINHGCMGGGARCATHDLWDGLGQQINQYLSSISLSDVQQRKLQGVKLQIDSNAFTSH
jgi:Rrf2 family transcriptional regulator, iron-sulfur cluster assembly transcription factor